MKKRDLDTLKRTYEWISSGIYKFETNEWSDPTSDLAILLIEIREKIASLDERR